MWLFIMDVFLFIKLVYESWFIFFFAKICICIGIIKSIL